MEQALRLLLERTRLVKSQELRISSLTEDMKRLKQSMDTHQETALRKDEQLSTLQLQIMDSTAVTESAIAVVAKSLGNVLLFYMYAASKDAELARSRESRAMELAQDTVESLQRQLTQRNQMVEKYRGMLKSIRREVLNEKDVRCLYSYHIL